MILFFLLFSKCLLQSRPDFSWVNDENLLAKVKNLKNLKRQRLVPSKKDLGVLLAPLLWRVGTRSQIQVVRGRTWEN
ncbi:uncharacterized protein F4807DRAFT_61881 [Annulohypoxylon truncatum]|uniref:uncharacterized protein n=1 Tax=Annulohypoxylon truncatum TaxID=327061 RepID=UPI002007C7EE|nr:uncharacterized protein F4807DRAFT_61881 [Annulohypoxylon truncatum]KAI1210352.1 hypothetical protein F4807DRAFT_61881 [Annulohypoxylon truncatum]